jgi:GDPmannose 4,6-dehydratase
MGKKKALITGITGQDGTYLSEFLLSKGYEVYGIARRVALEDQNSRRKVEGTTIIPGDVMDYSSVVLAFNKIRPDEVYHLAAQSDVGYSFKDPFQTLHVNIDGTVNILEAIKNHKLDTKFYFAGSSEMFGEVLESPQTEKTPFNPRSPYGVSKVAGFLFTKNYRESYGLFACSGMLFNHESPRRGKEFVTRKITNAISEMRKGKNNVLILGNLDTKRDWGFSGDYVKAMWMMLQNDKPVDYVVGTGETHTIKEFIQKAFNSASLDYELIDLHNLPEEEADKKIKEFSKNKNKCYVFQHPKFYRPAEVDLLLADYSKIKKELGWRPKIHLEELVKMMVESDINGLHS